MIDLGDCQALAHDIHAAHASGARLRLACETAGIDLRTLQRWEAHAGLDVGDGRPQAIHPTPAHALSEAERAQLLSAANEPRFAAVPPARIVPMLADEGVYRGTTCDGAGCNYGLVTDADWNGPTCARDRGVARTGPSSSRSPELKFRCSSPP
jgi:hypothetical protein